MEQNQLSYKSDVFQTAYKIEKYYDAFQMLTKQYTGQVGRILKCYDGRTFAGFNSKIISFFEDSSIDVIEETFKNILNVNEDWFRHAISGFTGNKIRAANHVYLYFLQHTETKNLTIEQLSLVYRVTKYQHLLEDYHCVSARPKEARGFFTDTILNYGIAKIENIFKTLKDVNLIKQHELAATLLNKCVFYNDKYLSNSLNQEIPSPDELRWNRIKKVSGIHNSETIKLDDYRFISCPTLVSLLVSRKRTGKDLNINKVLNDCEYVIDSFNKLDKSFIPFIVADDMQQNIYHDNSIFRPLSDDDHGYLIRDQMELPIKNELNLHMVVKINRLLGKDNDNLKYFQLTRVQSERTDMTLTNMVNMGLTGKGLISAYFKAISNKVSDNNFLSGIFKKGNLGNALNTNKMLASEYAGFANKFSLLNMFTALRSGNDFYNDSEMFMVRYMPFMDMPLSTLLCGNLSCIRNFFRNKSRSIDGVDGDTYFDIMTYDTCIIACVMYGWLHKFKKWNQGDTIVEHNGITVIVNHHVVLDKYMRHLTNVLCKGDIDLFFSDLPESIDAHPKDFFNAFIRKEGKKQYERKLELTEKPPFDKLPVALTNLPNDKWKHINTALDLSSEGDKMRHCIGGDNYLVKATDGDLIFHYDDESKDGLTIHIERMSRSGMTENNTDDNMLQFDNDGDYYSISQIRGKRNRRATPDALDDINNALLDLAI